MNEDTLIAETEPTEATEPEPETSEEADDDDDDDLTVGIAY